MKDGRLGDDIEEEEGEHAEDVDNDDLQCDNDTSTSILINITTNSLNSADNDSSGMSLSSKENDLSTFLLFSSSSF